MTAAPGGRAGRDVPAGAALDGAVELLDRSLAYTRVVLAEVRPEHVGRRTPCAGWTLALLLAHMEDALDAFTEAAAGHVEVRRAPPASSPVEALRQKACALLGAWSAVRDTETREVVVGGLGLDAPVLVATAALEVAVHGWDVAQATGARTRVPDDLARGLLAVAHHVITPADRGPRFGDPRPVGDRAAADARLLAWTGRAPVQMTGPLPGNRHEPPAHPGLAS